MRVSSSSSCHRHRQPASSSTSSSSSNGELPRFFDSYLSLRPICSSFLPSSSHWDSPVWSLPRSVTHSVTSPWTLVPSRTSTVPALAARTTRARAFLTAAHSPWTTKFVSRMPLQQMHVYHLFQTRCLSFDRIRQRIDSNTQDIHCNTLDLLSTRGINGLGLLRTPIF